MERRADVEARSTEGSHRPPVRHAPQAARSGATAPMRAVLALQQAAGNRAVAGLVNSGGGGGGGALKPSTFTADAGALAQGVAAAQTRAGGVAAAALGAAPPPTALPVVAEPPLAEPQAPALADGGVPPLPTADGDSLATGRTTAGLDDHERQQSAGVAAAGQETAAQAAALPTGRLGASRALPPPPRPPAPVTAALEGPDTSGLPSVEPEVAEVLDSGFGPKLAGVAGAAAAQRDEAVGHHGQVTGDARTAHDEAMSGEQEAVHAEADALDAHTGAQVAARKEAWRTAGTRIAATGRGELVALRSGAARDVQAEAGQANRDAHGIMTAARAEAAQQESGGEGTPVQRSLWGRIKSAASSAVRSVRDGITSVAASARRLLTSALERVSGLFDRARQAIADRVGRFVAAARGIATRVRDGLVAAGRAAVGAIRQAIAAGRAAFDRLATRLRDFAAAVVANLRAALTAAAAWLRDRLRAIVDAVIAAGRWVLSMAGKVRELLRIVGNKVLSGLAKAIEDPAAFVEPYKAQVGRMMAAVPEKTHEMYDQHVAPLFGGGQRTPAAASVQATVQRQETGPGTAAAEPSRTDILWEYLKQRFGYLIGNWPSVVGNVLLEIFVPFVSLYRHLPPMVMSVVAALKDLFAGRVSSAVDHGLKAARELMSILATLFAQVSIAAFIAGSILGTPIVGEAAMFAVGMGLLAADAVVQVASIAKAWSNLDRPGRTVEEQDEDYSVTADSIVSLGITAALLIIAAVGQKLGKVLLARFPRVAGFLTALRERVALKVRKTLGVTPRAPTPKPAEPAPRTPVDTAGAAGIARRLGINMADLEVAPGSSSGRVFRPKGSGGHGAQEIAMADRLAAAQGTDIILPKQRNQAGIDGFYRDSGQPVQLKELTSGSPAKVVARANEAFAAARDNGWSNVDLQISAPKMTKAQVLARWNAPNATPAVKVMDGGHISRIQVRCSDGVLDLAVPRTPPTPPVVVVPPDRHDEDKEEARTGG